MPKKKLITRVKDSNWKTSLLGILTLAASGAAIYGQMAGRPDIAMIGQAAAATLGGGGLLVAKDADKQ